MLIIVSPVVRLIGIYANPFHYTLYSKRACLTILYTASALMDIYNHLSICYNVKYMTNEPRLTKQPGTSDEKPPEVSGAKVLMLTALDTTWRAFVPTIGGLFLGIGIDKWLGIVPFGTISCMILGFVLSAVLIARQLISVKRSQKK